MLVPHAFKLEGLFGFVLDISSSGKALLLQPNLKQKQNNGSWPLLMQVDSSALCLLQINAAHFSPDQLSNTGLNV